MKPATLPWGAWRSQVVWTSFCSRGMMTSSSPSCPPPSERACAAPRSQAGTWLARRMSDGFRPMAGSAEGGWRLGLSVLPLCNFVGDEHQQSWEYHRWVQDL